MSTLDEGNVEEGWSHVPATRMFMKDFCLFFKNNNASLVPFHPICRLVKEYANALQKEKMSFPMIFT